MANVFDQFDSGAAVADRPTANVFDQFDSKPEPQTSPPAPSDDGGTKTSTGGDLPADWAPALFPDLLPEVVRGLGGSRGVIPGLGETGIPEVVGGIAGALVGGFLGDKAQRAALKEVPPKRTTNLRSFKTKT